MSAHIKRKQRQENQTYQDAYLSRWICLQAGIFAVLQKLDQHVCPHQKKSKTREESISFHEGNAALRVDLADLPQHAIKR